MADYLNIAGRVRTTASDGVAMEAQEVKDLNQNKSQQEINADVQTELGDRYTKEETYSKEQVNDLITTPDASYVNVVATNATTAVTDILPATGEANTIYRVGNWNGTQYDPTMYALFAWNSSAYVCLAVRSFVGEVYDVSVNHPDGQGNPTPYANLAAALGTDGANIPAEIRRGGMSIKFIQGTVQSSDNKYVQYRLMSDTFNTTEANWQGVDSKPISGSLNFAESSGIAEEIDFLKQKQDYFLPETIINISPDICINAGYINGERQIVSNSTYGYSDVIHVYKNQIISIKGVGTDIPYIAFCDSDGNITMVSRISSGINSVFTIRFKDDYYIRINGRIKKDGKGNVAGGIYINGATINEIGYNVKKYISTRGAVYTTNVNSVEVTLNTLFVYDVEKVHISLIEDTNTYTLSVNNRFLVLQNNNTIALRENSSSFLDSDFVLLYYDDSTLSKDIKGGALYADYFASRANKIVNSLNVNVKKYVSARGAVYIKNTHNVKVTLDTLFVYDANNASVTTISDNTEYTLMDTARFLVLQANNTITTRLNSSTILPTDFVLLYYDDNPTSLDIKGGALYADYLANIIPNNLRNEVNDKFSLIDYKEDYFLPKTVLNVTPDICINAGYINTEGQVVSGNNYGYTDLIHILSGQQLSIVGVGTNIPYFVYCESDGTFIRASRNSIGIDKIYTLRFTEEAYIKINGRKKNDGNGVVVGGLYEKGTTLKELTYNIKKYISTRGSVYQKNNDNVVVTLNKIFVYDIYANKVITINDNTPYTLSGSARFLVLKDDNTLETRDNSSSINNTDYILLYYDDNSLSKDIKSGALYADYLSYQLSHVPTDDSIKVVPSNLGQINCIRKAYQMAKVKWTPKIANTIPYNSGTFPATQQQGMIYSSVKEYTQFAFEDVSLETFMTAVNNPRSVLYTENVSAANSQSAIGRTYHGINCAAYYGSVCSGLLTFAYGLPMNVTTYEFRNWDRMEVIQDQTPYGLEIGDAIWQSGHIQLTTGVTKDKNGFITDIEIVENAAATTKIKHYTVDELQTYIEQNDCVLLRYKDLYANRSYVPLTQFVAVMDETQGSYVYNDDICPNYGEKSNYNVGDSVVLNLRTDYASEGFTTLEVYKDEVLLISRAIAGQDEILTGLSYGEYKARIVGDNSLASEFVHFKVVDVQVTKSGDSFTFSSTNGTPLYYEFCDQEGRRSYGIVGLSTHTFTSAELSSGEATPSGAVVSTGNYHYLKVHFQTDYGRVIKVIDWNV